jgi:glycosyltransferase 2 family protein
MGPRPAHRIDELSDAAVGAAPIADQHGHPYRAFAVRIAIGAALLILLLWKYGASAVVPILARERAVYFVATVALYVAGQVMSAYRWQLLAAIVGIESRFREFLAYYFVGMFTNLFVPGLVGGDAARAFYLGRRHGRLAAAAASAVADRGIGLVTVFWFAAVAALVYGRVNLPASVFRPIIALGILALVGFLAAPLVARISAKLPGRLALIAKPAIPYLERPGATVPAIVLSLVLQISLVACQYLLSLGLGLSIPFTVFLLFVPIANVFASLPITLNGLGVREGTYAVLFTMAGLNRADAVALGLLWFLATAVAGLTGAIAFVMTDVPQKIELPAESSIQSDRA